MNRKHKTRKNKTRKNKIIGGFCPPYRIKRVLTGEELEILETLGYNYTKDICVSKDEWSNIYNIIKEYRKIKNNRIKFNEENKRETNNKAKENAKANAKAKENAKAKAKANKEKANKAMAEKYAYLSNLPNI